MNPPRAPGSADDTITLRIGDVLPRIPSQFLKPGPLDAKREIRFKVGSLSHDIARGRAAVSLAKIAELCPEIFRDALALADNVEVRLPLQKFFEQLNHYSPPAQIAASKAGTVQVPANTVATTPKINGLKTPELVVEPNAAWPATISLSLQAIFRLLPLSVINHASPPDEHARVALPLRLIEPQLGAGHVEVSLADFKAALPAKIGAAMSDDDECKVWIPLDEIFPNLPAQHPFHFEPGGANADAEPIPSQTEDPNETENAGLAEAKSENAATETEKNHQPVLHASAVSPPPLFQRALEDKTSAADTSIASHIQPVADALAQLPGIFAAAVVREDDLVASEKFPSEIDPAVFQKNLAALNDAARYFATSLGGARAVTIECGQFFVSIHAQERVCICALHHDRALTPAALSALASAPGELLRQPGA